VDFVNACAKIPLTSGVGCRKGLKEINMKKILFTSFVAAIFVTSAMASEFVTETETTTTVEVVEIEYSYTPRYVSPVQAVTYKRPCATQMAAPVRVKTHMEVIDHYQAYLPVTVYKPVGRVSSRRIIRAPQGCNTCN
jgi:hypothetical protein